MNNLENIRGCFMAFVSISYGKCFEDLDNFLEGQTDNTSKYSIGVYDVQSFNTTPTATIGAQDTVKSNTMFFKRIDIYPFIFLIKYISILCFSRIHLSYMLKLIIL